MSLSKVARDWVMKHADRGLCRFCKWYGHKIMCPIAKHGGIGNVNMQNYDMKLGTRNDGTWKVIRCGMYESK